MGVGIKKEKERPGLSLNMATFKDHYFLHDNLSDSGYEVSSPEEHVNSNTNL